MSEATAFRITTVRWVYLIVALFVGIMLSLVLFFQFQADTTFAIRVYVGGQGLWAKAQKDAIRSLEHYTTSHDESDYQAYQRQIQVPLGDQKARQELQKTHPDLDIVREGYLQGRNPPVDIEYAIPFFLRFQHSAHMSRVIGHWTEADHLIAELNKVAEGFHAKVTSRYATPEASRSFLAELEGIDQRLAVEEEQFSLALAEVSRWAADVSRKLAYAAALLFAALGVGLSKPIITRIRATEHALSESEERFRNIFEHVGDIIYTVEPNGIFSAISPSCERILGWSPNEWIGRPFSLVVHPDDLPYMQELFVKARAGEPLPIFQVRVLTKSGAYLESEIAVNLIHRGNAVAMLGVLRDITGRKQAELALLKSRNFLQSVVEHVPARIFWKDRDSRYLGCNTQFAKDAGHDRPDELIGKTDFDMGWKDQAGLYRADDKATMESGKPKLDYEEPQTTPDGKTIWLRTSKVPLRDESQQVVGILGLYQDITEQKRIENTLRENEARLDLALRSASMGVWHFDIRENKRYFDDQVCRLLGINPATFAGTAEEFLAAVHPDDREAIKAALTRTIEQDVPYEPDYRAVWPDGSIHDITARARLIHDDKGRPAKVRGIIWDITERKKSETGLKLFRALLDQSTEAIEVLDPKTLQFIDVNQRAYQDLGYSREELLSLSAFDIDPSLERANLPKMMQGLSQLGSMVHEGRHRRKDGTEFPVEVSLAYAKLDRDYLLSIVQDITSRKQSERVLEKANRALRTLSACNVALVRDGSEAELLDSICRLIVDMGGYRMAWVGFPEQDAARTVRPVAHHGIEEGYLAAAKISWADNEFGRGPTGTAIRTGTVQVNQNLLTDPALAPWREAVRQLGYQSSIALPLQGVAGTLGTLTIYAPEPDAFDEAEVGLLQELAGDLAFGLKTLRMRAEHDRITDENLHHSETLRQSLEDSIKAIASTVEMRDPYTAGHQRRVGQLSVAIARELGLPEHTIHGIELASSIHDLGKISVPAEILAKPSKLTAVETMLLKNHAQAGYDILKDIKFPWPIATMVWQHHERLDGSGYPQGLKDGDILLESRIMAVADVVEAMASHRPYRAALGSDSALKEVERGRGSAYDPAVVDACLKLFAEKRFAFST